MYHWEVTVLVTKRKGLLIMFRACHWNNSRINSYGGRKLMASKGEFKGLISTYFVVGYSNKLWGKKKKKKKYIWWFLPSRRDKLYVNKCSINQCGIFTTRNRGSLCCLVKQAKERGEFELDWNVSLPRVLMSGIRLIALKIDTGFTVQHQSSSLIVGSHSYCAYTLC